MSITEGLGNCSAATLAQANLPAASNLLVPRCKALVEKI